MAMMKCGEPQPVCEVGAELGEGPIWDSRDRALWFVDIKNKKVHRYDPASRSHRTWEAPEYVCFLLPASSGGFVAGLKSGLFKFDPASGSFDRIAEVESDKPDNRLNDGAADQAGRLWFGTMDNKEKDKSGAFYRFAGGRVTPTGIGDMVVTNGPAVSPDGRTLYLVDTFRRRIDQAEIRDDGSLGERRPFVTIEQGAGFPDGPTVDSEGAVWIGLYSGWSARRYSAAGELIATVKFPAANITKLAFGGDDLRTVFATTARQGLTEEQRRKQPLSGHLFSFECDVAGVACPLVRC
jgi:sugar lactone lactonase YvrE